jgi:hypothetical protein
MPRGVATETDFFGPLTESRDRLNGLVELVYMDRYFQSYMEACTGKFSFRESDRLTCTTPHRTKGTEETIEVSQKVETNQLNTFLTLAKCHLSIVYTVFELYCIVLGF